MKTICNLISRLTFGRICLGWCTKESAYCKADELLKK